MYDTFAVAYTGVYFKGGALQLDAGRDGDAVPALKKSLSAELSQFPRHWGGVSSYMTDLFDKQASKNKQANKQINKNLDPKGSVEPLYIPPPYTTAPPCAPCLAREGL